MLDWAGINFGASESYKLQQSIKRLSIQSGADNMKFRGKIMCKTKDYWIVSGNMADSEPA
jgi:hypothetical protein